MEAGLSRSDNECSHTPRKRLEKCCRDSEVEVSRDNYLEHDVGMRKFETMAATTTTDMLLKRAARSEVVWEIFSRHRKRFKNQNSLRISKATRSSIFRLCW